MQRKFEGHYGTAIKELVHEKMKGHTIVVHEVERPVALKRERALIGEGEKRARR